MTERFKDLKFKEDLLAFLLEAHQNTYANKKAEKVAPQRLASEDYEYSSGDWMYHDTYFGGRDFLGSEIVYKNKIPVWGANYHGLVLKEQADINALYDFLREALMQEPKDILPLRGPAYFKRDLWRYEFEVSGDIDDFIGTEKIFKDGELLYRLKIHGGRIND